METLLEQLQQVASNCDIVEMVTPVNVGQEKAVWIERASKDDFCYIPSFRYNEKILEQTSLVEEKITRILSGYCGVIDSMLENRIDGLVQTSKMAQGILEHDDEKTKKAAVRKFGFVKPSALDAAKRQAQALRFGSGRYFQRALLSSEQIAKLDSLEFDAEGIKKWFEWALSEYGLEYKVVIGDNATAIDVRDRSADGGPIVAIPAGRKVSGRKLIKLLRHEIECHARDSYNGVKIFNGLGGGVLRCDDDALYEGHAMWNESQLELELFGSCAALPLPWYILAIDMAEHQCSVEEIAKNIFFRRLNAEKDTEKAINATWTTLYRTLFRGRTQAIDNGYYFPKDKAYLEGYLLVKELPEEWLSVGAVTVGELYDYMSNRQVIELPYPDKNLAKKLAFRLLE